MLFVVDVKSLVQDFLMKAQIMQLGTSHGSKPWVTTLYFAADVNMNIYWLSRESRRHSKEIENNSHVAGTIIFPLNYGDKVRGLQFEGQARMLKDQDALAGRNIYSSKFWIVEDRAMNSAQGDSTQGCYQLRPERFVLYDEVNFPDNPTQELRM